MSLKFQIMLLSCCVILPGVSEATPSSRPIFSQPGTISRLPHPLYFAALRISPQLCKGVIRQPVQIESSIMAHPFIWAMRIVHAFEVRSFIPRVIFCSSARFANFVPQDRIVAAVCRHLLPTYAGRLPPLCYSLTRPLTDSKTPRFPSRRRSHPQIYRRETKRSPRA